ncbi:NAD(P)H-binding protein [Snodgrassella sp.]|uniref:NAD(P)H-binding protein n=1 Tax=Snodgrassella sp. TaxID=2815304 RepID=UPI00258A095E|nr:NAD(P)H-binding protein [Snodgrassella sp.]MCO6525792.1 NAD(P)H-binding protein [Snodgrassella sp.]
MKTLLLFGVSPKMGTGYQLLQLALQQPLQWRCIALVRDADFARQLSQQGVVTVVGDATDESSVKKACELAGNHTVIVSTLGGSAGAHYLAQRLIIDTAEYCGIKQMLLVTSLGCGDSWPTMSERAKKAFGHSVREKSLAEVWLQTSTLNYEILRPGGLVNGAVTGTGKCFYQQEIHGYIHRAELASVIMQRISTATLNNCVYTVVDPDLLPANK